jgi:hypothetical protein
MERRVRRQLDQPMSIYKLITDRFDALLAEHMGER